jgi:hypothetical protein
MTDKSESSFAVVRFNGRTYQSGGVVAVIKGIEGRTKHHKRFRVESERGTAKGGLALFPRED